MKTLTALLALLISTTATADVKISQLPLASPTAVATPDSFPYVDSTAGVTRRLKLSDLPSLSWFQAIFNSVTSVIHGGTGLSSVVDGLPLIGSGTTAITQATRSGNTTTYATTTGTLTNAHCVKIDASGNLIDAGASCLTSASTATVPQGGTGVVTFTANLPILGNGTSAVIQGSVSGNTTKFATVSGSFTAGNCPVFDASGNLADAGGVCGLSGGTVTSVAATVPAWMTISGSPVTTAGSLGFGTTSQVANSFLASPSGSSGVLTPRLIVSADLPTASGSNFGGFKDFSSTSHQWAKSSSGGVVTTTQPAFADISGTIAGTQLTLPTVQSFIVTGTQTGLLFTVTSATAAVGDTYTNNGHTYVVRSTISGSTLLFVSGTGTPSGSSLVRTSGAGTNPITFSASLPTATYTPTANTLYTDIEMVGGGGGGGGSSLQSSGDGQDGATGVASSLMGGFVAGAGIKGIGSVDSSGATGGLGGAITVGSLTGCSVVKKLAGGAGGPTGGNIPTASNSTSGGNGGGNHESGGAGGGGANAAGQTGPANTGVGGGGGGSPAIGDAGSGGGAGGVLILRCSNPSTMDFVVGTGGLFGAAGTSGKAGSPGSDGLVVFDDHFQ